MIRDEPMPSQNEDDPLGRSNRFRNNLATPLDTFASPPHDIDLSIFLILERLIRIR